MYQNQNNPNQQQNTGAQQNQQSNSRGNRTVVPEAKGALNQMKYEIASELGINPTNDGRVIRLTFPAPTEDRRRQLTKDVQHMGEEAKVAVRNVRREAMDKFKALKKSGELTEDDQKDLEGKLQKITDKFVKEIDKICESKNKEIMEV